MLAEEPRPAPMGIVERRVKVRDCEGGPERSRKR